MAGTFWFYTDAGLVTRLSTALKASGASTDFRLWFGSPSTAGAYQVQADSSPGIAQITVIPTDTTPGSGHETSAIKLALMESGLAVATAGASLDIGTTVESGSANAVEVWARVADVIGSLTTDTTLGLTTNSLRESAT